MATEDIQELKGEIRKLSVAIEGLEMDSKEEKKFHWCSNHRYKEGNHRHREEVALPGTAT